MNPHASVAAEMLAYGTELEHERSAQLGGSFCGLAEADEMLESSANAFLLGCLFTQGIPAERAWAGPWHLRKRLGTIDPRFLAENPELVRAAVQQPPMLHRFKETVPRWIVSAGRRLVDCYGGDAGNIWPAGDEVASVVRRLSEFEGIGPKKAFMAVGLLTRHFGVELTGMERGQVAYDVHVRRVFLRTGLVDVDSREAIERAAMEACPESPGRLDLPAWLIGRDSCRPRKPACNACRLSAVCPRIIARTPSGVGVRRREFPRG